MRYNPVIFTTLICLSCVSFQGCRQSTPPPTDLSALGAYIAAYVPEVIRSSDPARIRFASAVVPDSLVGSEVASGMYTLSPAVEGEAVWEDTYTFRFSPANGFAPGRSYILSFVLGELFSDIDPEYRTVHFNFSIRPVELYLRSGVPELSEEDPTRVTLSGEVRTSESVESSKAEEVLRITYPVKLTSPTWSHSEDGKVHRFTIPAILREDADRRLVLSWDGASVNSPAQGSREITIPGMSDFRVTHVEVVQDETREIRMLFSDFLDPNQRLTGLIQINGNDKDLNIRRTKHMISIFPGTDLTGEFTVYADAAIQNRNGNALGESESFVLSFEDVPPQVELIGKGNIVPNSGEVILPFKAINLSAVEVEVFEIFESNVMQFLQYGDLWQASGYESVGRVVGRHVVELNALQGDIVRNQWGRYAIDLSHYTDLHPGSIYEIRIGFFRQHSLYACPDDADETFPFESDIQTLWHYYYAYDEYSYENRDDPCMREYYTADHFVRRNVLASNLGLAAKLGTENTLHVFAHDLRTTEAIPGSMIRAYDFQRQLISEGRTDNEGRCVLGVEREPAFVIAEQRGEKGYLKVTDAAALSVSDFDVDGTRAEDGMRGFIYGERDVWRPGDTVFLNFVLQNEETVPADHPVTCVIYNARGQKRFEQTSQTHVGPVYAFTIPTSASDVTGNWRAEMKVGGVQFNKTLKIETIKPNRLKINIDADGPVHAWEPTTLPLSVQWLHGSPAAGLEARVELGLNPAQTTFDGFSGYHFDDPARTMYPTVTTIFDGKLDANGNAIVSVPHQSDVFYPGKMMAHIKTRVFEKSGDFSTDQFSTAWWPYKSYAGIAIPENRWGYQQLEEGADNSLSIVAVDHSGKAMPNQQLSVGIYHADWHWWWNQDNYELAQFNSAQHLGAFQTDTVRTDAEGNAEYTFKPLGYGLYLIRVCDTQSGHCTGDFAYAGYFYGEEDGRSAAAKLSLSSDKSQYNVGDDVQISIPSAPGSLVIVSLENDQTVISTHQIKSAGELTQFSFRATADMAPNIYAHVRLVQPHNLYDNDMPIRMYGVIPVMVEDPETRLHPVLGMPDALRPEQTFELTVSEQNKQAMAYTVAVVDEGLLDLTRFETPDPWEHFYAKQALGVRSWDLYDQVLGGLGGPVERILAIGGDGSNLNAQAVNEVNRFKPVVVHLGPFLLKPGATAKHQITLPNYVGSIRAMIVASGNKAYGAAEKTAPVKNPVMVLSTLPRVLSPGEQLNIPVNVFAMESNVKNVEVSIRGNEMIAITGTNRKSLEFNTQGDQLVTFSADIAQTTGKGEVWIEAVSGNERASQHIEIEVRNPNPYLSDVIEVMLKAGESWEGNIDEIGMPGSGERMIELSSLFPANINKRLSYLIRYPYGCLEQTTSAAFPQLVVGGLIELSQDEQTATRRNVQAAIGRISRFMNPAGGFSYWPGGGDYHEWTNSYAGHFLIEAQKAGYLVDARLIDHWKAFQSSRAKQFSLQNRHDQEKLNQAYRLYTLALAGAPEIGAMNRLKGDPALPATAQYLLAASYGFLGQRSVAEELVKREIRVDAYAQAGSTFGSQTRDRALIVEALVAIGAHEQAWPIARRIAEDLATEEWYSTQTTAFGLIALSRIAGQQQDNELQFAMRIGQGTRTTVQKRKPFHQERISGKGTVAARIENTMQAPLFVRVIRRGRPLEPAAKATQQHLTMQVSYQDMTGKTLNPDRLSQGTDFMMTVAVSNPGTFSGNLEDVALETLFPSGWEILNLRLDNMGDWTRSSPYTYQDVRDDRIYTFFDLNGRETRTYRFALNAAYAGRFILPSVHCEAMYDGAVQATQPGKWVEVVPEGSTQLMKASVSGE